MKTVYIDSSAAIRWIMKSPGYLTEFGRWQRAASSNIFEVECLRTLDRLRFENRLKPQDYLDALMQLQALMDNLDKIQVSADILSRAKSSFIYPVKTLDAIHLASAILWQESSAVAVTLLSHDKKMNLVAKSIGLETLESV